MFSDLLMKSFEDAGSLTFRRLTANQPVPGTGISDDDDLAEVEINDLDQTLSVRNKETAQVCLSVLRRYMILYRQINSSNQYPSYIYKIARSQYRWSN